MALPPLIPELPPAPSRADGQANFTPKANAMMAALPPMVVNVNVSLTWVGEQVTAVNDYRQQAAQSATNAADSASAANSSKSAAAQSAIDATNNGKVQVDLAKAQVTLAAGQVTLAQQARESAQTAAAAAGAAAGLPALNGAGNLLTINPTNDGIVFGSPLPLLHATALLF